MPTARELLEQADALMRRNRADDDIPVLTDAVPSAQEAQSRFAPARRVAPTTVIVANARDDVPLLTDEVEEIEAAAPLDPEVGEGEPSVWLDLEGESSVIGDAPDSIAIVPPVNLKKPPPPADLDEFDGLDEELAAAIAAAPREEEALQPPVVAKGPMEIPPPPAQEPPPRAPVFAGGAAALLHADAPVAPPVAAPPYVAPPVAAPPFVAPPVAAPPFVAPPVAAPPFVAPRVDASRADASAFVAPASWSPEVAPAPLVPVPVAAAAVAATPPAPAVPDAAHWEAMAEEIRMQVLQRIDLFTDTGLRTQLGERLQPIVDRASADLVATINQHVGELLRAYVAEAIEREIDSWRRNH